MNDVDPELAERLKTAIARAITETCKCPGSSVIVVPYPECADALVGSLIALSGELELYDDPEQREALAQAAATRISSGVRALREARRKALLPH
jgi:nucleotide-binding universal stress UspA family protein